MRVTVHTTDDPNAYAFQCTPETAGARLRGTITRGQSGLTITQVVVEADDVTSSLLRRIQYGEILSHARQQIANLAAGRGK